MINGIKYAKRIGVNLEPDVKLLGRVNWGTEPWLIYVGTNTMLSKNVTFWNHDGGVHVVRRLNSKYRNAIKFGFIRIGKNCFIGANSTILLNVSIGDNCIIGANSLVTKDIPTGEVWGGIPAKRICSINEYGDKIINMLGEYDYNLNDDNKKEESIKIAELFEKNK